MVTDITPAEFVFGKLLGVLYVTKEMILLPMALLLYLGISGAMTIENTIFLNTRRGVVVSVRDIAWHTRRYSLHRRPNGDAGQPRDGVFLVCWRGDLHGDHGQFSRGISASTGTFLGDDSRWRGRLVCGVGQSQSIVCDLRFIVLLPLVTFYAITQFLLQRDHSFVLLAILAGYGFTMAAMLVPVISEFEVSLDRDRGPGGESS